MNEEKVTDIVMELINEIGEDVEREGLVDTPKRMARMYKELFKGYKRSEKPNITTFDNGKDGLTYDQLVLDTGNFYSMCEHHMMPFFGKYWFAYIPSPKGKIIGLSKIARVVDYYSSRMQIQERLGVQIVDEIEKSLEGTTLGIAIVMKAKHLCKSMRGIKKEGFMTTIELRGVFKEKPEARAELMSMIKLEE